MSQDWPSILRANRIEFVEHGPSTAKGNIYVHCPFCGAADVGHLMGISTQGKGWGCWRNPRHRGKSSAKLLGAILGIPFAQAERLLESRQNRVLSPDNSLAARVREALGVSTRLSSEISPVHFPKELRPLEDKGHGRKFVDYLAERGFKGRALDDVIRRYKLRYAIEGLFAYRIIIPIYTAELGLECWTGRSIVEDEELRYLSLSADPEKAEFYNLPRATAVITDCLFHERELLRHDSMCQATALFGKAISPAQLDKLAQLASRKRGAVVCEGPFDAMKVEAALEGYGMKTKMLLLDSGASMDAFRIGSRLEAFGYKVVRLPEVWKDPGVAPTNDLRAFLRGVG